MNSRKIDNSVIKISIIDRRYSWENRRQQAIGKKYDYNFIVTARPFSIVHINWRVFLLEFLGGHGCSRKIYVLVQLWIINRSGNRVALWEPRDRFNKQKYRFWMPNLLSVFFVLKWIFAIGAKISVNINWHELLNFWIRYIDLDVRA